MKPGLQTLLVSFAVVSVDRDKVSSVGEISLPLCNRNLSLFRFEMEFFFKKAFSIRFHDPFEIDRARFNFKDFKDIIFCDFVATISDLISLIVLRFKFN